jgi:1-phosphofructokinase
MKASSPVSASTDPFCLLVQKTEFATVTPHPAVDRIYSLPRMIPGEALIARRKMLLAAGKGVNAARILKILLTAFGRALPSAKDARIRAYVWVGVNEASLFYRQLREAGVRPLLCSRPVPTRFGLSFYEFQRDRTTHIRELMEKPTAAELRCFLAFLRKHRSRGWTAFCGSAPPQTPLAALKRWCVAMKCAGGLLLCDAGGPMLAAASAVGADVLKGNAVEIGGWLFGGQRTRAFCPNRTEDMRRLQRVFEARCAPAEVIVTLGAQGALLARRDGIYSAQAPQLPKNKCGGTVGCGDAATAGRLWAAADVAGPEETLRRVVACGSAKAASADPGKLNPAWVATLLKQIEVRRKDFSRGV